MAENNTNSINNNEEYTRSLKRKRPCHPVWQSLSWNTERTFIFCNLCQRQYGPNTGVSTIKNHFVTNHQNEWKEIEQKITLTTQPTEVYSAKKIARIETLLLRWIIRDQQPFSVVEDEDFRDFVTELNSRYKLLSRQTISTKIQQIYEKQRDNVKEYFNNYNGKVALTTDIWTACTNQAYMSITLHWIDDKWKMNRILLDLISLHERHTSTVLVDIIYTVINDFNLCEKIIAITTDNASNMNLFEHKFSQLLSNNHGNTSFHRIRCAAHILNLIVRNGLEEAKALIAKVREFSIAIRSSQVIFEDLKRIFAMKKLPLLILITLLEPIYQATNLLSASSYPTFGDLRMVFLVIADIIHKAQQENNTIQKRMADKMNIKLNKYWEELKSVFQEATILDPNNKLTPFRSDKEKHEARNIIHTTYQANYATQNDILEEVSFNSESLHGFLRNHFKETYKIFPNNGDPLNEYLNSPVEDVDILVYWNAKSREQQKLH
ncbi:12500_t:CDS:2 [Acaulospora morrowiae]|uniref:12500_t:CDS:1 n=1 Tax=Acaulospora morrowiae TaxID=94023 RepID=A0A9N9A7S0_9GLOM|nr:12500_t:CDS:2 [Acaulospora morrowiae]